MRVFLHILLAFVAIGVQRVLDRLLDVGAARLDLVMIAAGFSATCFPKAVGPLVAAVVGLAYDLSGAGPIGLHAAALGLGGLAAASLPSNRWSQLLSAVAACVAVASIVLWALGLLRWGFNDEPAPAGLSFLGMLGTIALTSLFAVAATWPLWKWRRAFALDGPRF